MSTETPPVASRRTHASKKPKRSFWKRDLGSLGKDDEEPIEHPPFVPTLPFVDVLPDKVREAILLRKVRRWLVAIAILVALLLGGIWYLQKAPIDTAEAGLAEAQVMNDQLQASAKALMPVQEMYTQISSQQDVVRSTMASQPQAAAILEHMLTAAGQAGGKKLDFTTVNVVFQGIPEAGGALNPCPKADPFATDITVGCLSFSASARDRQQVTAFLQALEADGYFVGPYITVTTTDEGVTGEETVVDFTGTTGISPSALQIPLTPEETASLLTPPTPTPTPEAGG